MVQWDDGSELSQQLYLRGGLNLNMQSQRFQISRIYIVNTPSIDTKQHRLHK